MEIYEGERGRTKLGRRAREEAAVVRSCAPSLLSGPIHPRESEVAEILVKTARSIEQVGPTLE
jgi:hypothetical protein